MILFRHILTSLLVCLLLLSGGLGAPLHASMSNDAAADLQRAEMPKTKTADDQHMHHRLARDAGPDHTVGGHENCDQSLCHVLVMLHANPLHQFEPSEDKAVWLVTSLSAIGMPENPEHPPNF